MKINEMIEYMNFDLIRISFYLTILNIYQRYTSTANRSNINRKHKTQKFYIKPKEPLV